jgi:hypothetical protein
VCHPRRIHRYKVFEGLAQHGKTTLSFIACLNRKTASHFCLTGLMVWFFGLKLHIIINDKGQIMAVKITPGNTDDRAMLKSMLDGLKGKCFADKGYIAKSVKSDQGFYDRFRDQIKTYSQMGQIKHDQNKPISLYLKDAVPELVDKRHPSDHGHP